MSRQNHISTRSSMSLRHRPIAEETFPTGTIKSRLRPDCTSHSSMKTNARYLVSWGIFKLGRLIPVPFNLCSTLALRFLNLFIVVFVAPRLTSSLYRHIHPEASDDALLFAELLPAFPLLSFFGNLYYTDTLATTVILWSYLLAIKRRYISSAMVSTTLYSKSPTSTRWLICRSVDLAS